MKKSQNFKIQGKAAGTSAKTSKKRTFLYVTLAVVVAIVFGVGVFFAARVLGSYDKPTVDIARFEARTDVADVQISQTEKDDFVVAANKPRYLSIAKLGVNQARVQEMGVLANNQLDAPQSVNDAGWYKDSALPGSGSKALLIDGHNTGPNERGIFWELGNLVVGDEIIIERGDGEKFTYKVVEIEQPLLENVDMAKMMQSVDASKEGLNIITCSGTWIPEKNTFDHRTTIRAVRE